MPAAYLEAVKRPGQDVNPLIKRLRMRVTRADADEARIEMTVAREHLQGAGVLAGGVLATLLDEAMAYVVLGGLAEGETTATVELSVRYFKPLREGDILVCRAWAARRGSRVVFTEGEVLDAGGETVAKASASFLRIVR